MKEYFSVLKKSPIFGGLDENELESVLSCLDAKVGACAKDEFILRSGSRVNSLGLLLSGEALIVQEDFWGNRNLMARVEPGQIFAEAFACLPDAELSVSVICAEPCEVMWLDVKKLMTVCPSACSHHTKMIRNLLTELAGKDLRLNEKLTHMGKRTTRDKLLSYLSSRARESGRAEFDIPFTRQQLADYLSVERSAMSAELGRLRDDGVLTFNKNHFLLRSER